MKLECSGQDRRAREGEPIIADHCDRVYGGTELKRQGREMLRNALLVIALAALAGLWIMTYQAIAGPHPLPAQIATHFDAAGNANGWGEPKMLWLLPIIGTGIVGLMTVVSFYPGAFNYLVRVTPTTRARFEAITLNMIAWVRAELVCLFLWIQDAIIRSAREGRGVLSLWLVPVGIVVIFASVAWHFMAMLQAAREAGRGR